MSHISWKEIILGTMASLSILIPPATGQVRSTAGELGVHTDNRSHGSLNSGPGSLNRGRGSLNSGPGSLNSGPGSLNSGRDHGDGHDRERRGVENRLEGIREDRRNDRLEDRLEHRRMDRREDRQADRREDHRSNAGGEVRGLDRADHVAGEHGREGKDRARFMQNDGQDRGEWIERYQRPERLEHTERSDRPDRSGRH